jgi:hypothetical protein
MVTGAARYEDKCVSPAHIAIAPLAIQPRSAGQQTSAIAPSTPQMTHAITFDPTGSCHAVFSHFIVRPESAIPRRTYLALNTGD